MTTPEARTVFVHVHIPKCGGTSFNEVLWRNFRLGFHMEYGRFNMLRPTADEVEYTVWRHDWFEAMAGHRFHSRLNYRGRDHRLVAFTFVRDPVQHFTSTYNFMRRVGYPGMESLTILEAAEWILGGAEQSALLSPWFVHGQLEHLDPEKDLQRILALDDADLLYVFPVERFADVCLLLGALFPKDFTHTAFRVKNTSPRIQEADPQVTGLVRRHRHSDFNLHAYALARLDQRLAEHFDSDQLEDARRKQRRRCRLLGSMLGEADYVIRRMTDLARKYLERRKWIRPSRPTGVSRR